MEIPEIANSEIAAKWERLHEGLTDAQAEKVRLVLEAAKVAHSAREFAYGKVPQPATARQFAKQYFAVVEAFRQVAQTKDEPSTVAHMETVSRLIASHGLIGFPASAQTVHAEMNKLRG